MSISIVGSFINHEWRMNQSSIIIIEEEWMKNEWRMKKNQSSSIIIINHEQIRDPVADVLLLFAWHPREQTAPEKGDRRHEKDKLQRQTNKLLNKLSMFLTHKRERSQGKTKKRKLDHRISHTYDRSKLCRHHSKTRSLLSPVRYVLLRHTHDRS